jgi:hypothetical protein
VGTADDWQDVACNDRQTCGIRSGRLYCWGLLADQFDGAEIVRTTPQLFDTRTDWQAVVGANCALRAGELYCWGTEMAGQLGVGFATTARPVGL